MRIAVTGSNGFIGKELVKYLLSCGHEVVLLQRKEPAIIPTNATYVHYDLNEPDRVYDLKGVDALVHTAYMPFTTTNNSSEKNIKGTMALYHYCIAHGVRFVFLSSMSAHENALSQYGRHKYQLEKLMDPNSCLILKLGLVIGKEGLFNRIYQSLKKMPFTIIAGGGNQPVQPVYVGDVVSTIERVTNDKRTGVYTLAVNRVYTMRAFFNAIGAKAGRSPIFINVPYWLVSTGIRIVELLHLPFPVSNENLLGLKQLQAIDTSDDLKRLGVSLLDLDESIEALVH